ncbi:hypothetical protein POM88_019883 [Heracleum sosnowskyi]|uniref:Uncharacterized protein n=1 Tax=Heracleum sosnowskyi TaxID=360622 RepID=A0AAD8IBI2_9APIA|nr:hypothetical protein POM88_019883 [Heracleum sosnowskyi]
MCTISTEQQFGRQDTPQLKQLLQFEGKREVVEEKRGSSFLLRFTLTYRIFQILSGFGHKIEICFKPAQLPDRDRQVIGSTISFDLQPNEQHNFLGMMFRFSNDHYGVKYSIKNIKSGFIWNDSHKDFGGYGSTIVILPSSIFPIRDGDKTIEFTSEDDFYEIYLLYKTEVTIIKTNTNWINPGSTTVNVKEGSYPWLSNLESQMNSLCLGSNTVNVEESSRRPFKRLKR